MDALPLAVPLAVVLGTVFGLAAYRLRVLTASGAVAGAGFGATLLGVGGWAWALPALGFFGLSSLLSKLGRARAARLAAVSEGGSRRDAGQVFANGGVAWLCLLGEAALPAPGWSWAFLGALAAATADTWATEVGTLVGGTPRLVTTLRPAPPGTSGAVSGAGLLAALAGGAAIWLLAVPGSGTVASAGAAAVLVGSGFGGALVDSLLGATVQARYRDGRTGRLTERATTDGQPNSLVRGWRFVRNDGVNLLCTATGALLALVLGRLAGYL